MCGGYTIKSFLAVTGHIKECDKELYTHLFCFPFFFVHSFSLIQIKLFFFAGG